MAIRNRETVIVDRDSGGNAVGIIAGIVIVALVAIAFVMFLNSNGGSRTLDVDVPAVNVDVVPDGQ